LTRRVGDDLLLQAPVRWLWHGRDVKIVDGTTWTARRNMSSPKKIIRFREGSSKIAPSEH